MLRGWLLPLLLLGLGIIGYMAVSRLTFAAPTTMAESNECGFNPADFTAAGELRFSTGQAWWVSFIRQQEYFSALSLGLVVAFVGCAVGKIRQIGTRAASGAVAGGGTLAVLVLCLSCLAPTLSAIGVGLLSNLALTLAIPKWLMTLNTVLFITWGVVFLSRRARACSIRSSPQAPERLSEHDMANLPHSTYKTQGIQPEGLATRLGILLVLLLVPTVVQAENWETILTPARPGLPLANPITTEDLPPPPSLCSRIVRSIPSMYRDFQACPRGN